MWININDVKSKNAFINILHGVRSRGKTFGLKESFALDFLNKGDEFIYLRRYETELGTINSFWDDIVDSSKIPKEDAPKFKTQGRKFLYDGQVCGYNFALSKASNYKSTPFHNVTNIFFDEYVIEDNVHHYLKNEVEFFLSFLDTVIRTRDNVKVWLCANNVTIVNPYTTYFNLVKRIGDKKWFLSNDNLILFYMDYDKSFADTRRETKLGKLIADTQYGKYAIDNEAYKDDYSYIMKKPKCRYLCTLKVGKENCGIWIDYKDGNIFISNDINNDFPIFTIVYEDHTPNDLLLDRKKYGQLRQLSIAYRNNHLFFETLQIKKVFYEALKFLK